MISKRENQGRGRKRDGGSRNNVLGSGVSNCPLVFEEIWPLFKLAKRTANQRSQGHTIVRLREVIF